MMENFCKILTKSDALFKDKEYEFKSRLYLFFLSERRCLRTVSRIDDLGRVKIGNTNKNK